MLRNTFFVKKSVFRDQIWAIKQYPTIYFVITNWYTSFQKELSKLNSIQSELYCKKAEICKKKRFFIKNVGFETRFGQLSGIQQFILS